MKVLSLEAPRALEETIHTVQHGGVVAFPTDTVYGIGASLRHPDGLKRIYKIKGRDMVKPLPVLLSSIDHIDLVAEVPHPHILALLRHFWPGGLTVALPAKPDIPDEVTHADGSVGVRVPDHSIALALCDRAGGALATTSANRSGEPPACSADDVIAAFGDRIDMVLRGGYTPGGEPSTVIRVEDDATIAVIRAGSIESEEVENVWARIQAETDSPA
ncbi:MAG TPA: L-threonylcarbamoyladenylate synthase [Thermomicrobiales bacterium]|nr:L-threonylcarbamoyladenylate synthase [Thermomicrobiales bacterium]